MVVGKHSTSDASFASYEIRSGMSVQDLKQLTAQRAQRQRAEYWELQARNSPRQMSVSRDWSYSSPSTASSTSSSTSSTSSGSPLRNYGTAYYYSQSSPPYSPSGPEKMFVTCGGQVVSFMEGVVNAPQIDFLPDMLSTL